MDTLLAISISENLFIFYWGVDSWWSDTNSWGMSLDSGSPCICVNPRFRTVGFPELAPVGASTIMTAITFRQTVNACSLVMVRRSTDTKRTCSHQWVFQDPKHVVVKRATIFTYMRYNIHDSPFINLRDSLSLFVSHKVSLLIINMQRLILYVINKCIVEVLKRNFRFVKCTP